MSIDQITSAFIVLWAVMDPIGTVPVFLAVTQKFEKRDKNKIAATAVLVSFLVLLFFLVAGEVLLKHLEVPLSAFQVSGGLVLLLFALSMIFGDSKPEEEIKMVKSNTETAIFPLAMPSIASPGAILAIILLTNNARHSVLEQVVVAGVMVVILGIAYLLLRFSDKIYNIIGNSGAIIISKVMGMVLASMAATHILLGIKDFFQL